MATYLYLADDGDTREVVCPMLEAPKIGSRRKWDGKWFRRVPTVPEAKVSINPHFVSHSLPRAKPDHTGKLVSPYSKEVEPGTGKPRFSSWKAVRDAEAFSKHNDQSRAVVYD